jgi:hypothetical protein
MTNPKQHHHVPSTPAPVPVALTSRRGPTWSTSPIERNLVARLGGSPWTGPDPTGATLASAFKRWGSLRTMLGLGDPTAGWMTDDTAKAKKTLKASPHVKVMFGVTYRSAHGARDEWASLDLVDQLAFAGLLNCSVDDIGSLVGRTTCEHSTFSCRLGCCVAQSINAKIGTTPLVQLARTLLLLTHPAEALELTYAALASAVDRYGRTSVLWRMNIGDDIRWELVAPGLLDKARGYAYTKHPVADRPEISGATRIVYSVSEHWSDADITNTVAAGHTVAMVFDITRTQPMPSTWSGIPVVDGDRTDELWAHPYGVIVGLSLKGNKNSIKEQLRAKGFARALRP